MHMKNTYLVMLAGNDLFDLTRATHVPNDILAQINGQDAYFKAIDRAMQALIPRHGRPRVILAGYSLGGMEAQNIAASAALQKRYRFIRVIDFGSPRTFAPLNPSATYTEFTLFGDHVPAVRNWLPEKGATLYTIPNPNNDIFHLYGHLDYVNTPFLLSFDALGLYQGKHQLVLGPISRRPAPAIVF